MVEQKIFLLAGSNLRWKFVYQLWVSWAIFSQMKNAHILINILQRKTQLQFDPHLYKSFRI